MATACLSVPIFRPVSDCFLSSRRPTISRPTFISLSPSKQFKTGRSSSVVESKTENSSSKWAVRMSLVEQIPSKSTVDVKRLVDFLYEDLPHLFDDQGIDRTAYSERVKYQDPITKHETITGYLFNIAMLKKIFTPDFQLHWVKPVDNGNEIHSFALKPELIFTGTSVMGINPETGKFCSHADYWDSIEKNDYFSLEGLWDVMKQLRIYKTPDLETPKYQILKRTATYEVRKYSPFIVVETDGDKLAGSTGFNTVSGWYIFGKNSTMGKVSIQIVLPSDKDMNSLPDPNQKAISLRKVEGGIAAVSKFSGKPTEDVASEKEKSLRSSLLRDGLKPKLDCLLACYNNPGRTWSFMMRNEVLIWLEESKLD